MTDFQVVSPSFPYLVFCALPISDDALFHFKTRIDFNVFRSNHKFSTLRRSTVQYSQRLLLLLLLCYTTRFRSTYMRTLDCFSHCFFHLEAFFCTKCNIVCGWKSDIHHIFDVHIFLWRMCSSTSSNSRNGT